MEQDNEFTEYVSTRLSQLQDRLVPCMQQVLEGEIEASSLFRWVSATVSRMDFEYVINPFSEDLREILALERAITIASEAVGDDIIQLYGINNIETNRDMTRELDLIERRTNGYILAVEDLTSFIRRYNEIPPREQVEFDLLQMAGIRGLEDPIENREFSPQFLLPVEEQVANYNRLRSILRDLIETDLTIESLNNFLSFFAREQTIGSLYYVSDQNSISNSEQAARRYNESTLVFSTEEINYLLRSRINDIELEYSLRGKTFFTERLMPQFRIGIQQGA
tara:strand:- start:52 stop:891 length:840 start_codon:yes stop_codon:yes gene_type:complete